MTSSASSMRTPRHKERAASGCPSWGSRGCGEPWSSALVLCVGRGQDRRAIAGRLVALGVGPTSYASVIHPRANAPLSCSVGAGSVIMSGVTMTAAVTLGRHVVAMPSVTLTHDNVIEDFVTLCAGVILGGNVRVAEGAYVGMGERRSDRGSPSDGAPLSAWARSCSIPCQPTRRGSVTPPVGSPAGRLQSEGPGLCRLELGGTQTNAIQLAARMRDDYGHQILFHATPGPASQLAESRRLDVVPAPDAERHPSPARFRTLESLIRADRPDLVHVWDWPQCFDSYASTQLLRHIPTLCTAMGMIVPSFIPRHLDTTFGTELLRDEARRSRSGHVDLLEPPVDVEFNKPRAVHSTPLPAAWGVEEGSTVLAIAPGWSTG